MLEKSDHGRASSIAMTPASPPGQGAGQRAAPPVTAGWQDGFVLQSPNGENKLVLGLTTQMDARFPSANGIPFPRHSRSARRGQPSPAGLRSTSISRSCQTSAPASRHCWMRTSTSVFRRSFESGPGRTKLPSAMNCCKGIRYLLFPERSLASLLVPNRDVGFQVTGRSLAACLLQRRDSQRSPGRDELDDRRRYE